MEGGADADGRGPSVWDEQARLQPERFYTGQTPAVTADFYHRYPEDIALMRELGLKSFRFSISWSRVLPLGRGPVNEAGIAFYNRVIDALLANGIQPFVDLYHWDLPWALAGEGGFNNPQIVDDFAAYARAYVPLYPRSLSESDSMAASLQQDEITNIWLDPLLKGLSSRVAATSDDPEARRCTCIAPDAAGLCRQGQSWPSLQHLCIGLRDICGSARDIKAARRRSV
jgi:beta-glucosidase/6-phospho-beta-glucosidase/beta-galactosidase